MKYQMKNLPDKTILSGIYKVDFPSGKSYIGMSNNIKKRIWAHNEQDYKRKYVLGYAINKYGPIQEFEILEYIDPNDRELMSTREKYWIQYYNTQTPNGYNRALGGEGASGAGLGSSSAKFNEKTLLEVIDILQNHPEETITNIASKYNVTPGTIHNINNGYSYFNSKLEYPLRDNQTKGQGWSGTKSSCSKLTETDIENIFQDLMQDTLSQATIARKYSVSPSTINLINKGKHYRREDFKYPIRTDSRKKKRL